MPSSRSIPTASTNGGRRHRAGQRRGCPASDGTLPPRRDRRRWLRGPGAVYDGQMVTELGAPNSRHWLGVGVDAATGTLLWHRSWQVGELENANTYQALAFDSAGHIYIAARRTPPRRSEARRSVGSIGPKGSSRTSIRMDSGSTAATLGAAYPPRRSRSAPTVRSSSPPRSTSTCWVTCSSPHRSSP